MSPRPAEQALGMVAGTVPFSAVDGPGNRFVIFLQGCHWDCLACHNPCSIPPRPRGMTPIPVGRIVAEVAAVAPFLTGVTVTGGEATNQAEFVHALFTALAVDPRTSGLSRFLDSNGDADPAVWELLAPVTDAVMLDLKALDDDIHVVLTGASNVRVLAAVADLSARGLLHEVRLLMVPGLNDDDATLRRTARWLLEVDEGIQVRLIGLRRHGVRACGRDLLEPGPQAMAHYREVLTGAGITRLLTVQSA